MFFYKPGILGLVLFFFFFNARVQACWFLLRESFERSSYITSFLVLLLPVLYIRFCGMTEEEFPTTDKASLSVKNSSCNKLLFSGSRHMLSNVHIICLHNFILNSSFSRFAFCNLSIKVGTFLLVFRQTLAFD